MGSYTGRGQGPGGSISYADVATTMELCEPDVAEQERPIPDGARHGGGLLDRGLDDVVGRRGGAFLMSLVAP